MAKATSYDPAVVQRFADRLYERAAGIILLYSVLGILVGVAAGGGVNRVRPGGLVVIVVGAVIGGVVGFVIGSEKAFWLRLQAQTALCQVQIERNPRSARL